jgi:hypothetical protein
MFLTIERNFLTQLRNVLALKVKLKKWRGWRNMTGRNVGVIIIIGKDGRAYIMF